jgi:predicted nucleic acid-binding protein
MTYALDTNTILHLLGGNIKAREHIWYKRNSTFTIPQVVYYEILRGFRYKAAPAKEATFDSMCEIYDIGELTTRTWVIAAQIYADLQKRREIIEDADILIAAFCIEGGYTLITNNVKHMKRVDGLIFEDWVEN